MAQGRRRADSTGQGPQGCTRTTRDQVVSHGLRSTQREGKSFQHNGPAEMGVRKLVRWTSLKSSGSFS